MGPITLINVRDTIIDINDCTSNETTSEDQLGISPDDSINQENVDEHFTKSSAKVNDDRKSDKRKPIMSAKKPPRPKRGTLMPFDAADERLIKEIAEMAKMKRARIKAIKKMKAAKASNNSLTSSSSSGNFIAMVFTIVFCLVMISQGCHSWRISPKNKSAIIVPDSQMQQNSSNSNVTLLINNVGYPNLIAKVHGSDEAGKTIHQN